jgi:hypothetical protein
MTSCKTTSRSEKQYEKLEEKNVAAEQKEYDNRVKGHKEMQSKDTQKMLKRTEKESKRLNKSRKPKLKKC